jgi:hypothetical protein
MGSIIPWKEDKGVAVAVTADIASGISSLSVEVSNPDEVLNWEKLLKSKIAGSGELGDPVTLAIIDAAVKIIIILILALVLAYAIQKGYTVSGKKTAKGTMQFDLKKS